MVNQSFEPTGKINSSNDQNRKIFLGGLNYHTTDEILREYCARFGSFSDCLVMRNPEGKSRGFGFVTYEDEDSVEHFMQARPHNIGNRQIDPKRAMPREDQNSYEAHLSVKKLFVAGLRDGIDENALREHFNRFGTVTEVLVMKDREGKHRGFAFVSFDDYDAVDKAVLGKPHVVNGRPLDIKKAIPKDKMQEMVHPKPPSNRYPMGQPPPPPPTAAAPSYHQNQFDQNSYSPPWSNSNGGYDEPSYPSQGYNSNPYPASYSTNMNYDGYSTHQNNNPNATMPFNSNSTNNYMQSMSSSYGSNQPSTYGQMNMPFGVSSQPTGFNDETTNSFGMMGKPYSNNYNQMSSGSSRGGRGGGPMRAGRGGFSGNNSNSRPNPYTHRGGGRGRGRGQ